MLHEQYSAAADGHTIHERLLLEQISLFEAVSLIIEVLKAAAAAAVGLSLLFSFS